jgi:CRISPR-associated protein Cas2
MDNDEGYNDIVVMYDISDDKVRSSISKICLDEGMYRVQKSIFLGELDNNIVDELKLRFEDMIDENVDSVYLLPTSKDELNSAGLLGQAFDKELVSDELITKFF